MYYNEERETMYMRWTIMENWQEAWPYLWVGWAGFCPLIYFPAYQ